MNQQDLIAEVERLREHLDSTRLEVLRTLDMARRFQPMADIQQALWRLEQDIKTALDPAQAAHERGWAQWKDRVNITR
jgi:hypothetical protein